MRKFKEKEKDEDKEHNSLCFSQLFILSLDFLFLFSVPRNKSQG